MVLYEMMCGRLPFYSRDHEVLFELILMVRTLCILISRFEIGMLLRYRRLQQYHRHCLVYVMTCVHIVISVIHDNIGQEKCRATLEHIVIISTNVRSFLAYFLYSHLSEHFQTLFHALHTYLNISHV